MRVPSARATWKALIQFLDNVGRLNTLAALGLAGIATTLLGWVLTALDTMPILVLIPFLVFSFLILLWAAGRLVIRLSPSPHSSGAQGEALSVRVAQHEPSDGDSISQETRADREERKRAAIHVITTLEHHKGDLQNWPDRAVLFAPSNQGEWGANRPLFTGSKRYDKAVRNTERAFQAVGRVNPYALPGLGGGVRREALEQIETALGEWERILHGEMT